MIIILSKKKVVFGCSLVNDFWQRLAIVGVLQKGIKTKWH